MGVVFGGCLVVLVCVVFVVLLVASVLASMRWLLCGGDGSQEKTTSVISKKMSREGFFPLQIYIISKTIKSAPRISVIIFAGMVCELRDTVRDVTRNAM